MSVTASLAAPLEAAGGSLRLVLGVSPLDLDTGHLVSVAIGADSAQLLRLAGVLSAAAGTHTRWSIDLQLS